MAVLFPGHCASCDRHLHRGRNHLRLLHATNQPSSDSWSTLICFIRQVLPLAACTTSSSAHCVFAIFASLHILMRLRCCTSFVGSDQPHRPIHLPDKRSSPPRSLQFDSSIPNRAARLAVLNPPCSYGSCESEGQKPSSQRCKANMIQKQSSRGCAANTETTEQ